MLCIDTHPSAATAKVRLVSSQELIFERDKGRVIIDIRPEGEYAKVWGRKCGVEWAGLNPSGKAAPVTEQVMATYNNSNGLLRFVHRLLHSSSACLPFARRVTSQGRSMCPSTSRSGEYMLSNAFHGCGWAGEWCNTGMQRP